jgi:hypothetical protein
MFWLTSFVVWFCLWYFCLVLVSGVGRSDSDNIAVDAPSHLLPIKGELKRAVRGNIYGVYI